MDHAIKLNKLREIVSSIENKTKEVKPMAAYRFDIFKGTQDENGKVTKVRSVGSAYIREGYKTYTVSLKTFLKDRFYLLPNGKSESYMDYVILTREPALNLARKYFWNSVGAGHILDGVNHGLMKLSWDVLAGDLYMSLHPIQAQEPIQAEGEAAA